MKRFVLSRPARTDVKEIWVYIAEDSLDAADRWTQRLRSTFQTLADDPGLGHKRTDLTAADVLFWTFGVCSRVHHAFYTHGGCWCLSRRA